MYRHSYRDQEIINVMRSAKTLHMVKIEKMSFLYLVKVWTELFLKLFTFLFYLSHIKSYDQMNFGGLRDHIMRKQ